MIYTVSKSTNESRLQYAPEPAQGYHTYNTHQFTATCIFFFSLRDTHTSSGRLNYLLVLDTDGVETSPVLRLKLNKLLLSQLQTTRCLTNLHMTHTLCQHGIRHTTDINFNHCDRKLTGVAVTMVSRKPVPTRTGRCPCWHCSKRRWGGSGIRWTICKLEMWANAQHDGCPAEYRWRLCSTPQTLADAHY